MVCNMLDNDTIKIMDMEIYRIYEISEGQGYSESLVLFRTENFFYYGNQWPAEGGPCYSGLPSDANQYMVRELDYIDQAWTLREVCDDFLDLYDAWANKKMVTPKGFSVFETFLTPAQLARAAKGPVTFTDEV